MEEPWGSSAGAARRLAVPVAEGEVSLWWTAPALPRGVLLVLETGEPDAARAVGPGLAEEGIALARVELLGPAERELGVARALRLGPLVERALAVLDWLPKTPELPVAVGVGWPRALGDRVALAAGGRGAAVALRVAARRPDRIEAIVCVGGRPDLAGPALGSVRAPTLLVGLDDELPGVGRCRLALERLGGPTLLARADGRPDEIARLAAGWVLGHLVHGGRLDPEPRSAPPAHP